MKLKVSLKKQGRSEIFKGGEEMEPVKFLWLDILIRENLL